MLNPSQTPSPKPKSRFFSNLRRSLRSNSQLTSVPESLFDPVPKTLFSTATESPSHADTSSSYATSSSSSNPSSPASNTPSRQLTPPQRRHASSFSKITFSAAEFLEDRYIYAQSPEKLCLSHELMSDESLPEDDLERVPFFAIPTTRKVSYGTQDIQSQEQTSNAHTQPIPAKKPLIKFYEDYGDLLPEFNYEDPCSSTTAPKKPMPASNINQPEFAPRLSCSSTPSPGGLDRHNDPYCSESYSSDLGHDDSPTLGYYSEFPTTSKHSSPKAVNWTSEKTQASRSRIIDPGNLLIPCDFDFLSSILDTPPPIPQETFTDDLVGMAY
ncbi:hypothetical protein PGT21_004215 [Puccinia graminis f. sp. tritici]|uniref:Uncharacterized protein n=1 Tax=Puccinia graminis f. sp. tritici TaxID=56615 RepID=A0A5B0PCN9_PUCGR|nr:hypothetical protein PGTUg99_008242 [Puccinia graminis f. sp. tritici]KAA1099347.1 hypothetical protein PGT21_004215 [Puccinia graminis f. sp. tritici]